MHWSAWPLPDGVDDQGFVPFADTCRRFRSGGFDLLSLIVSSEDDWDRYESLHWRALEEWLAANPDDPQAPEFRRRHDESRDHYLQVQRGLLGWVLLAGRKRA